MVPLLKVGGDERLANVASHSDDTDAPSQVVGREPGEIAFPRISLVPRHLLIFHPESLTRFEAYQ